ncbi:MAG: twin-arginine translocase subunit TatC [Gammaproteobacteria bacterium]
MATAPPDAPEEEEQPFISHLVELRTRLLRGIGAVLLIFLSLCYFAADIYHLLALPLIAQMPQGSAMIATEVTSPFFAPFKLTLVVSAFLAMPYVLHQVWAFVAPGLYRHERRLVLPLLISSSVLFYCGIAFAYVVVFPVMFAFFSASAPEGVLIMTDIGRYLDFVLTMFFAFGAAFQVPLATVLLVHTGIATKEDLRAKRPYIIVGAFVVGMVLTPPDVISQTLLAIPLWLLYELGLVLLPLFKHGEDAEPRTPKGSDA